MQLFSGLSYLFSRRSTKTIFSKRPRVAVIAAVLVMSSLSSVLGVFMPAESVSAVTSTDCPAGEFIASSASNTGPAYCAGPATCSADGGTWNATTHVCTTLSSGTRAASMPLSDRALSYVTLNALRSCISSAAKGDLIDANGVDYKVSEENTHLNTWWRPNDDFFVGGSSHKVPGSYLNSETSAESGEEGKTHCNDILKTGITLWGYTDSFDLLCDADATRYNGESCLNTSEKYFGEDAVYGESAADAIYTTVKDKVYGGKVPTLYEKVPGKTEEGGMGYPGRYLLYESAFLLGCSPVVNNSAPANFRYESIQLTKSDATQTVQTYEGANRSTKRYVYVDRDDLSWVFLTCAEIAGRVNIYSNDYKFYRLAHPSETVEGTRPEDVSNPDDAPGCGLEGVGWIVCPALDFVADLTDGAYDVISSLLKVETELVAVNGTGGTGENATYTAWSTMRNIANVAFVIVFLIIIFSQLTSLGVTNYGVKKMLPRLVIAAVLVNLSYYVCQLAVDLSNILGGSLKEFFDSIAPKTGFVPNDASGTPSEGLGIAVIVGTVTATTVAGVSLAGGLAVLIPVLLGAVVAVIMILLILILRKAVIVLLVIVAPLAFVAYLLPNTEPLFKKWRQAFTGLLILYPIVALVFGGSALAATILSQVGSSSDQDMLRWVAVGAATIPFFVVPGLLKKALDGLGAAGSAINNIGSKAGGGLGNRYKNSEFNKFNQGQQAARQASVRAGEYKGKNPFRRLPSAINSKLNKEGSAFDKVTGGYGQERGKAAGRLRAEDIAKKAERLATEMNTDPTKGPVGAPTDARREYTRRRLEFTRDVNDPKKRDEAEINLRAAQAHVLRTLGREGADFIRDWAPPAPAAGGGAPGPANPNNGAAAPDDEFDVHGGNNGAPPNNTPPTPPPQPGGGGVGNPRGGGGRRASRPTGPSDSP